MTEHLRRDTGANPEQSRVGDPNPPEKVADRPVTGDTASRAIVTPPPGDLRGANVTSQPGIAAATARAPEEERAALFAADESNNLRAR